MRWPKLPSPHCQNFPSPVSPVLHRSPGRSTPTCPKWSEAVPTRPKSPKCPNLSEIARKGPCILRGLIKCILQLFQKKNNSMLVSTPSRLHTRTILLIFTSMCPIVIASFFGLTLPALLFGPGRLLDSLQRLHGGSIAEHQRNAWC